jgi:4-diphosphocytidyl-2-C-methyl-D-erythritol kinase
MTKKVYKSFAKINIFLKIIGQKDNYHEIMSRFLLVEDMFDAMWFVKAPSNSFDIIGDFDCPKTDNTIYKAYKLLLEYLPKKEIVEYCKTYKLVVHKAIPTMAGLGGGSSNAATFLKMINEALSLDLSKSDLLEIGRGVGSDVPFFIHGYRSANVSGIGDIVEEFKEDLTNIKIKISTPAIECNTVDVYQTYKKYFSHTQEESRTYDFLKEHNSIDIFNTFRAEVMNDLLKPALKKYPELYEFKKDGWYLSGSGSSFFELVIDENNSQQ